MHHLVISELSSPMTPTNLDQEDDDFKISKEECHQPFFMMPPNSNSLASVLAVKISSGLPIHQCSNNVESCYSPNNEIIYLFDRKSDNLQFFFLEENTQYDNSTFEFLREFITIKNCGNIKSIMWMKSHTTTGLQPKFSCYCLVARDNCLEILFFSKFEQEEILNPKEKNEKILINFLLDDSETIFKFKNERVTWMVKKFTITFTKIAKSIKNASFGEDVSMKAIRPILEDRHFIILFDNNHVYELSLQNYLLQTCSSFILQAPKDHTYIEFLTYQQFLFCSLSQPSENLNKIDIWDISKKKKAGFVNCDIVNLCNFKLSNNGLLLTAVCDNDVYIIDLDMKTENVKEEEHVQRTDEDFDDNDDTEGDEEEEDEEEEEEEDELSFNELLNQSEKKTDAIEPIESLLPFRYTSENFYQSHWFDNTEPQKRSSSVLIDSGDDFSIEKDTKSNYPFVIANKQRKETILRDSLLMKRGSIGSLDSNLESLSRKDSLHSRTSSHNLMLSPRKDENISHIDEGITVIHAVAKNSKIHDYIMTNSKCYIIFDLLEENVRLLQVYDMPSGKITAICLEKGNFISKIYCSEVHCFYVTEDAHKHGVFFINVNTNKSILLNNLIKYERQRLAERLCDLNGWDRKSLAVHAIELGLRNRELAVVQDTLQHLDPEQELNVCYIIAKFIQDTKFSKDSEFKIHTITTAISYILSLIEKRILELGSNNEYNLGEEEPNTFDSIFIFKDKRVPIKIESTDSVIKKLEIKNAKKLDKFMESQTISEIDEITIASDVNNNNNTSTNTISIIEDIMNSKQALSKPEEVLLLSNIISLLRSYLIYNNQEEQEVNEPIAADLLSSFNSQSKRSETIRSEKRIDLDLSLSGGDNFNDLSFFGSEMKTGVSINYEEDMYNYDAEENEISDADEKNEMEMFDKILMRGNEELYQKWKNMENKAIIVDCLTKGVVSLGYSFLKNRTIKHKSVAECDSEDEDNTNNFFEIEDFESFQELSFIVIYEHLVSGEYNLAIKMLENLGEDVTEHLRELAFNTIDKNIRNHLIKELKRMKKISEEEQDVIEFLQLLEELYPDTSIQKVLEKMLPYGQYNPFSDEDFDQVENNIVIGDISDDAQLTPLHHITSSVVVESPLSSDSSESLVFKRKVSIQSRMRSASISSGNKKILALTKSKSSYFVSKLSWLMRWDSHTRERILLEKDYHDNESNKSKLAFCVAHHDFVGLVRWSKSAIKYYGNLKKKNESVKCYQTEDGDILYVSEGHSSKMQQVLENCQELINIAREQLQFCSPMMKELLLNSLAFRGIFIKEDTKDFISLLKRFCSTYQLFSNDVPSNIMESLGIECDPINMFDSDKEVIANPINTTYLHPVGEMSKFHKDFISFCIEKNIPSICFRYIDKFNIWSSLDKHFSEDKRPAWLNMFLLSNKKDMFNLSFINAQSKLRNNDNQKINLNTILNENPIMALSTQMYSPKTLHEALEEPITSEHYLNSSYLSKALQPYPTFHSALFNERSSKHSENPTLSKENQEENETINLCNNEIARGNIVSCQKDISLFDMLKHTHIDMSIDEILMMDEGDDNQGEFNLLTPTQYKINNRDDLFNFSTNEASIKEVLDISYYLMNQRPLEAYKELLCELNASKNNELKDLIDDAYSPYLYGGKNEQIPLSNYMDKTAQLELCNRVREIALSNFSNQAITSSCKMFIDLCAFEDYSDKYAKIILVETKVARRIIDFHPSFVAQVDQQQHADSPSKKLIEEFLQISLSDATSSVYENYLTHPQFKILKMLEEATESMLIVDISVKEFLEKEYNSKNSSDPSQVQILDGMRNSGHKIYVSPWKLLSIFSDLHGLPPFVNQLKTTAKKGQWISFLYHAQDINAPIETVMSIVEEFMPDVIKQFLIIVLRDMKSKRDHTQNNLSIEQNNNDILMDINQEKDITFKAFLEVMRAEEFNLKNDEVVEYLLNRSLSLSEPLLAIVATCYLPKDYTMAELFTCMKCYLQSLKQKLTNTEMKKSETISIKKQNMKKLTESIDRYIQDFCSNNFLKDDKQSGVHYITQSFELFDVKNPLISFLQFYESYVRENTGKATEEMKTFVKIVKDLNSGMAPNFNFGDLTWVVSTSTALAQQLSRSLNTQFKRTNYLQLLHQTQFSLIVDVTNEFENMYSVNSLFERVFKSGEFQEIDQLNVFTGNPNHFIETLIQHNWFKEARQVIVMYRKKITYSNDKITYSQALYKIEKVRSLYVTNTTDIIAAYSKVNDLFIKHRYPQESGAKFFLEQAILFQSEFSSTSILHLLNLALSWYEGTYTITKKRGSIEMTKTNPTPCRNQKDIEYLVQSIVLLSNSIDNSFASGASIVLTPLEARFIETSQNSKRSTLANIPTIDNNMDELLEKVIDNLLLKGQYKEAKKLANYYSYNSNILQTIEVALTLAKGYELQMKTMYQDSERNNSFAAKTLPSNIYSTLKEMVLNIDEFDDIQQILDKMSLLSFGYKMKGSKHFLKVIALNHKIGRILQLSYDSVITKDDFEVLKLLLMMFGKEKLKVCSSFIQLRNLDSDRASQVCANYLYSTYVEYYRNEDVSIFKNQEEGGGEILIEDYFQSQANNNNANDSTSSTDDFDDRLSTSSGSSFSSFDFSSSYTASVQTSTIFKQFNQQLKSKPIKTLKESQKQFDLVKCTMDEFAEFANIAKDPSSIARQLMLLIESDDGTNEDSPHKKRKSSRGVLNLKCKVEIIIRAYHCYHMSSSFEGIESILKKIKGPIIQEILDDHDFSLIVRLLISIPDFSELTFLFDILIENEQFELILKKNKNTDQDNNNQLKMALSSYVQTKFPEQNEKLAMVYLRFNMLKEYGTYLYNRGCKGIKVIHKRLTDKDDSSTSISTNQSITHLDEHVPLEHVMKIVCENFESAASSLAKEDCCQTAVKSTNLAALVKLQLKFYNELPNKKKLQNLPIILELGLKEARTFIQNHSDFEESFIIANAYDINTMSDWIEPLYNNCVKKGDLEYFNNLRQYLPTSTNLFREVAKRVKLEKPLNPKNLQSFHKFLTLCADYKVVMDICEDLLQVFSSNSSLVSVANLFAELNKKAISILDYIPIVATNDPNSVGDELTQ